MSAPISPIRVSHVGLCVADLDRSLRFYCEGLGFAVAEGYDLDASALPGLDRALEVEPPVQLRSQMIVNDAYKIELLHFTSPPPYGQPSAQRNAVGFTHLSLFVDDVDTVADGLVTLGGTILPATRTQLGYEVVFLADPDGVRVELMAPTKRS